MRSRSCQEWLSHLESLNPNHIELGLERIGRVVAKLALPRLAPLVITVAGTNGKGSSAALLAKIYQCAGYRTALYSSPHLKIFNERGRVNGRMLDDQLLAQGFSAVAEAQNQARSATPTELTYFEFTTLAIFWAFAQNPLDIVILEVGLGGRLDAVNIIDPDLCLITPIALDHQNFLGDTREGIGAEKAGIFRAGVPVVCTDTDPPKSVVNRATELNAPFYAIAQKFGFDGVEQNGAQWRYHGVSGRKLSYAYPALRGIHQLQNTSGVLATIELLNTRAPVSQQAIREGLANVVWPGRFQILPGTPSVILDVGHNPHAMTALINNLMGLPFAQNTHAVFGVMADKDYTAMLTQMTPYIDAWHLCDLPSPRAATAQMLAQVIRTIAPKAAVHLYADATLALTGAKALVATTDRILVFGSFLTVGQVLPSVE